MDDILKCYIYLPIFIYSGCIATCKRDYEFPNGVTRLAITCMNEEWHIYGTDWDSIPHCEREFYSKMISFFGVKSIICAR